MRILNTHTEWIDPDDPYTEEEILDICCSETGINPCAKTGRVSPWSGYDGSEPHDLPDDPFRRRVIVELVGGPEDGGPCGELHEEWSDANNCCDGVLALVWDDALSGEVVGDWDTVRVAVAGGRGPYYWEVRGNGFFIDAGRHYRDIETMSPELTIYTADACGLCKVTVTDGCSKTVGALRSVNGSWGPYEQVCGSNYPVTNIRVAQHEYTATAIYRIWAGGDPELALPPPCSGTVESCQLRHITGGYYTLYDCPIVGREVSTWQC